MGEHDRGVPRPAAGRRPEQAAHERAVVGDDAHRLAWRSSTPGSSSASGQKPSPNGRCVTPEGIAHDRIGWPTVPRLTSRSRSVRGKVVLVTGAASGMGRAIAHLFADEGAASRSPIATRRRRRGRR